MFCSLTGSLQFSALVPNGKTSFAGETVKGKNIIITNFPENDISYLTEMLTQSLVLSKQDDS